MSTEFKPLIGSVYKVERKFLCTKKHLLDAYLLENAELMHSYGVYQKYVADDKYRKYIGLNTIYCVHHTVSNISKDEKSVQIKDISEAEFNAVSSKHKVIKIRTAYKINGTNLILDVDRLINDIMLVEVWGDSKDEVEGFIAPKGLHEVTGNKYFSNKYIATSSDNIISRGLVIIEGTDLIGKTTVMERLVDIGYACYDRDQYNFSNNISLELGNKYAIENIMQSYKNREGYHIFVLYTSNNGLLASRLEDRRANGVISEYDEQCIEYNEMYKEVTKELKKFGFKNLTAIDVYERTTDDIIDTIISIIESDSDD